MGRNGCPLGVHLGRAAPVPASRHTRFAGRASVPYAGAVPDGGRHGFTAAVARRKPPSSSGLGHRPFKAAARVRIPLGVLLAYASGRKVL